MSDAKKPGGEFRIFRHADELLVSSRNYDLVSLVTMPCPNADAVGGILLSVAGKYWKIHHRIYDQLRVRCPSVIQLHGRTEFSTEIRPKGFSLKSPGVNQCHFNVQGYISEIKREFGALSRHEQKLIEKRIQKLIDSWSFPCRSLPCVLWADDRNQLLAAAMGKADFYWLMSSHHPYWAAITRMMLAEEPEIAGLLALPAQRVKVRRIQVPPKKPLTDPAVAPLVKEWEASHHEWQRLRTLSLADPKDMGLYQAECQAYQELERAEQKLAESALMSPDEEHIPIMEDTRVDFHQKDSPDGKQQRPLIDFTLLRSCRPFVSSYSALRSEALLWIVRYLQWGICQTAEFKGVDPGQQQEFFLKAFTAQLPCLPKGDLDDIATGIHDPSVWPFKLAPLIEEHAPWQELFQIYQEEWGRNYAQSGSTGAPYPPILASEFFLNLINRLVGSHESEGLGQWYKDSDRGQNFLPEEIRLEIFLSHSDLYPIILKTQHGAATDLFDFWNWLRQQAFSDPAVGPIDTASLIGFAGDMTTMERRVRPLEPESKTEYILDHPAIQQNKLEAFHLDQPMHISLLVKLQGGQAQEIGRMIKNALEPLAEQDMPVIDHGMQLAFWDLEFSLSTRWIGWLFLTISEKLRKHPNIAHTALRPQARPAEPGGQMASNAETPNLHQLSEEIETRFNKLKVFIETIPVVAGASEACRKLCIAIHNLKMDLEWLFAYLVQLQNNWQGWDYTVFRRHGNLPITFKLLQERIDTELRRLINIIESLSIFSAYNWLDRSFRQILDSMAAEPGTLPQKIGQVSRLVEEFTGKSKLFEEKKIITLLWEAVTHLRNSIRHPNGVKGQLAQIANHFKEEGEVIQAVMMTEPFLRVGEQSGIMTLSLQAADRLFRDYCATTKKNQAQDVPKVFQPWQGLVTASSGRDFNIISESQILELPVDFKFHVMEKLTPLAHESGHFILRNLRDQGVARKNWERLAGRAVRLFEMLQITLRAADIIDLPYRGMRQLCELPDLAVHFLAYNSNSDRRLEALVLSLADPGPAGVTSCLRSLGFVDESIFPDGLLSAFGLLLLLAEFDPQCLPPDLLANIKNYAAQDGKLLFRDGIGATSRREQRYLIYERMKKLPTDEPQPEVLADLLALLSAGPAFALNLMKYLHDEKASLRYPAAWIRLAIMESAARQMGWTDLDGRYDPWEVWGPVRQRIMRAAPGRYFNCEARLRLPVEAAQLTGFPDLLHWVRFHLCTDSDIESVPGFCLWWALQAERQTMPGLNRFAEENAKRFVFYPYPKEGREAHYPELIRATDLYCQGLVERLIFNCEVILNARPKHIAAAAALPISAQPYYPTSRILMSLRYSAGGWREYLEYLVDYFRLQGGDKWDQVSQKTLENHWVTP